MGVKIKNMEMPKSCFRCQFMHSANKLMTLEEIKNTTRCFITGTNVFGHCKTRSQDCPLEECK